MSNLLWYINRLKLMLARELPYRFRQAIKKKIDGFCASSIRVFCHSDTTPNLHESKIDDIERAFPNINSIIVDLADKAIDGRFRIFGIDKDFGHPANWHLDPKTGAEWPLKFWGDIDHRDGETIGGIKFAWELNRLHHLPILALAFRLTNNSKYKEEIFNQLRSWLDANPYPKGINWINGIELGIRLVNLVFSLKLLGVDVLTSEQKQLILEFVAPHGRHLYRYPSKYSSCNNHALAEALGLFVAGLCFPQLNGANKWKKFGATTLNREVARQIYPDGSSFEHSLAYLQFVLEHFVIYHLLCKEHNEPCGEMVKSRIERSLEFIASIIAENGAVPSIGDEDDGYILELNLCGQSNFVSLLNTGVILFDNPYWIQPKASFDFKTFCLLGAESRAKWETLRKQSKNRHVSFSRYFPNAGLAVIRGVSNANENKRAHNILFIGNSGPLGLVPLAGHGHADALSFTLTINDAPIIVDTGTYLYHSGRKWRNYFRSTSAHSTIRVDKQDQASILSDFMFSKFYNIKDACLEVSDESIVWSAAHDGYMRLKDPVFHKRIVAYLKKEGRFIIEDLLYGNREHLIECLFHFHPDSLVSLFDHTATIQSEETKITLELDKKWESCQLVRGQNDPVLGWYSPSFNQLEKTSTLICSKKIHGTEEFRCVLHLDSNPKFAGKVKHNE